MDLGKIQMTGSRLERHTVNIRLERQQMTKADEMVFMELNGNGPRESDLSGSIPFVFGGGQ